MRACRGVRRWIRRRGVWHAPPLPYGPGAAGANASLRSAVPLAHCGLLWAQHGDASLLELARAAHPQRRVLGVAVVRRPTSLFFSEFVYKKHCLWRQQGVRPDVALCAFRLGPMATLIAQQLVAQLPQLARVSGQILAVGGAVGDPRNRKNNVSAASRPIASSLQNVQVGAG